MLHDHDPAHTFQAMNTACSTLGLPPFARRWVERWFAHVEERASRFRPDSELMRINQSLAPLHIVSLLMYQLLREADLYFRRTDGIFSPYLGRWMHALGYEKSFEKLMEAPHGSRISPALTSMGECSGKKQLYAVRNGRVYPSITINRGAWIDLGGIAKGWSVQTMAKWLQREGLTEGVLNAGGDMVAWRDRESGQPWVAHILPPHSHVEDEVIARLELRGGSVALATSSTQKRRWQRSDGEAAHHIIDPRTKRSSVSTIVQASVLLPDATAAEVYAKCLIILGEQEGIAWLHKEKPEAAYLLVRHDGSIKSSSNLDAYCTEYEVSKHVECT